MGGNLGICSLNVPNHLSFSLHTTLHYAEEYIAILSILNDDNVDFIVMLITYDLEASRNFASRAAIVSFASAT